MKEVGSETVWSGAGTPDAPTPEPGFIDNLRFNGLIALEYSKETAIKTLKASAAIGILSVAAALPTFPLAKEVSLENARVTADIADAPTELSLTGNGYSSLQLGLAGAYHAPITKNGIGMSAEVKDAPQVGNGTIQEYFSPTYSAVLSSLFHEPQAAINNYAELLKKDATDRFISYEVGGIMLLDSLAIAGLILIGKNGRQKLTDQPFKTGAIATGVTAALLAGGLAASEHSHEGWVAENSAPVPGSAYPIYGLAGTAFEGVTASNSVLQLATNEAVPSFKKNIARMDQATDDFVEKGKLSFLAQVGSIEPPRDGEIMYFGLADVHGSEATIQLNKFMVDTLYERYGKDSVKFITESGDLTTNGTAAENTAIDKQRGMGLGPDAKSDTDDIPVAAVGGDHETPVSDEHLTEAGMINPDLQIKEVIDGVTVLGANDRAQKKFGVDITHIDDITEEKLGEMVRELADEDHPNIVLLHQGYAVMSFMGLGQMSSTEMMAMLADNGIDDRYLTTYREDGIENMPTDEVDFGHWHLTTTRRIIWNKDPDTGMITWTLVRQLNTGGGADGSPTFNRFSLPSYPPLQNAQTEITYRNTASNLVTGYASVTFTPDAQVIVEPRTDVGLPGGQPGYVDEAKGSIDKGHAARR